MARCPVRWLLLGWLSFLCACAVPRAGSRLPAVGDRPLASAVDAAVAAAPATPRPQGRPEAKNQFDVMFGASWWDDLGDIDASSSGPILGTIGDFDSWGWAFDLGYDRVVFSGRDVDVSVGLETGWSTFYNDGYGYYAQYSEITGNMWYIAPAVRWHFELSPAVSLIAGLGAGYYGFSIDELTTYYYGWWWGYDSRTIADDGALGGFASLAFDFHTSPNGAFRLENKLHYVEFDGLDSVLTSQDSVHGPIWNIEIGYVFRF